MDITTIIDNLISQEAKINGEHWELVLQLSKELKMRVIGRESSQEGNRRVGVSSRPEKICVQGETITFWYLPEERGFKMRCMYNESVCLGCLECEDIPDSSPYGDEEFLAWSEKMDQKDLEIQDSDEEFWT